MTPAARFLHIKKLLFCLQGKNLIFAAKIRKLNNINYGSFSKQKL